ncbi:hypothetical protein CN151_22035 [Sinorhizobium meliloti]|nr:hypothetical protein [Sinorhizobium meliloti]MDW9373851.1 hypothetical protein [Sinorhizobium meliloti]MDW9396950.1 hypothetical protein [Sinorhizobium meliloti]MDW9437643.1 hypothetical protein [Sinorhizobium meliloti]MDW9449145.1 hypothetical protein [Sinorhizobium meliloti]
MRSVDPSYKPGFHTRSRHWCKATPLQRLIPVPVTGIQPAQVIGLKRLFRAADAALLPSL